MIVAVDSTINNTTVRNWTNEIIRYVTLMLFLLVASEHGVRETKSQCSVTCLTWEISPSISMLLMVILSLDTVVRNFIQSQCHKWKFHHQCGSSYITRVPLRTDEVTMCLLVLLQVVYVVSKERIACIFMALLTLENKSDVFGRHTRGTSHPITSAASWKTGFSVAPL